MESKREAPSNYLNDFKDVFRQDRLVKTKSTVGLNAGVSGDGAVKVEDQEADKDVITVIMEPMLKMKASGDHSQMRLLSE